MPILQFPTDPERYPGEQEDLVSDLKAARQQLTEMFGMDSDVFRHVDGALRAGDLPALRVAQAEVKAFLRTAFDQILGEAGNTPEVLAEIARKMEERKASKPLNFLDWVAEHNDSEE
jgi:hypothetical protein